MKKTITVAAATITLSCLTVATPVQAEMRDRIEVRIPRAGLDLGDVAQHRMFLARVRRAAAWACAPTNGDVAVQASAERCRQEMMRDAGAKLAALSGGRTTQLASIAR